MILDNHNFHLLIAFLDLWTGFSSFLAGLLLLMPVGLKKVSRRGWIPLL